MTILRAAMVATLGLSAALILSACHGRQDGQATGGDDTGGHHGHRMDFSTMTFPATKADFLAKINARVRQRCASRDVQAQQSGRGLDCAKLEAGIAKCATSADIPDSIVDQDDAHDAAREYFECLRDD